VEIDGGLVHLRLKLADDLVEGDGEGHGNRLRMEETVGRGCGKRWGLSFRFARRAPERRGRCWSGMASLDCPKDRPGQVVNDSSGPILFETMFDRRVATNRSAGRNPLGPVTKPPTHFVCLTA
jgi:hypothetical protein